MKLIPRPQYLNSLISVKGTPDIKVITGIRRSGKSKLMEAYIEYLQSAVPDCNIIHINYNLTRYDILREYHELHDYVEMHYVSGRENFLFIDEVQMCPNFEKAIIGLHTLEKYDIYITGSNAFLLSSDLATLFTGRVFEIQVFPFSFREFVAYYQLDDLKEALNRYMSEGGMAGSYPYVKPEQKYSYIRDVYNTLVIRDISAKYKIRRKDILDHLSDYLMDNISNISSARSIAEALNRNASETNNRTVTTYLNYLCSAFAFYRIRRYDIHGKKYLASSDKYYLSDHSFRTARLDTRNPDTGRVLENIVAIELLRRGYEVYAGVLYKKEIDFVAMKPGEKLYIQVSDNISHPETLERELAPIRSIKDMYPKILLARTEQPEYDIEGIRIINLADWLAQQD